MIWKPATMPIYAWWKSQEMRKMIEQKKIFEKIDSQKLYIFDAKPSSTHQRSSAQETSSRKNSKRFILDIP